MSNDRGGFAGAKRKGYRHAITVRGVAEALRRSSDSMRAMVDAELAGLAPAMHEPTEADREAGRKLLLAGYPADYVGRMLGVGIRNVQRWAKDLAIPDAQARGS